ncbi:MAG: DsrE family protein [Caldimicrobium sp.]
MKELKLLVHVPASSRFEAGLKQSRNFALAMGERPYKIKILVNFEGVKVLENFTPYEELFKEVINYGAEIYFCENALRGFNVPAEKVPAGGKIIPSGILALVEWQEEGFRYVRA